MGTLWKFQALDTLFFRDSRPMNAGETVWIESQFPPTGRTLQGAIRTAILNHIGVTYQDFLNGMDPYQLKNEIGGADSLGKLSLTGPIIFNHGLPYFPVPLDLVCRQENREKSYAFLKPAERPTFSDLGNTRFPVLPKNAKPGFKQLSGSYVNKNGMEEFLKGNIIAGLSSHLCPLVSSDRDENPLICREPKMGLARENFKKTAKKGNLYAIAPVRPFDGVQIATKVEGLNENYSPSGTFIQRLGGEGKMAAVSVESADWQLPTPQLQENENSIRFKLVCITPADMPGNNWLPDADRGYSKSDRGIFWTVNVLGASFDIISACIGKPFKQGGWDHAKRFPRPLYSFVPAGSVYFCQADKSQKNNVLALHGKKLGRQTEYGFGLVLVGRW